LAGSVFEIFEGVHMKIADIVSIITMQDIEKWLENQADDELFTIEEIAKELNTSIEKIIKRISNLPPKYRYKIRDGQSYYGNPQAIQTIIEMKKSIYEN